MPGVLEGEKGSESLQLDGTEIEEPLTERLDPRAEATFHRPERDRRRRGDVPPKNDVRRHVCVLASNR
jgi:hypothetical protein